jgi:hypothetical protein
MHPMSHVLSRVVALVSTNANAKVAATEAVTITFLLVWDTPAAMLYTFNAKPIAGLWEKSEGAVPRHLWWVCNQHLPEGFRRGCGRLVRVEATSSDITLGIERKELLKWR